MLAAVPSPGPRADSESRHPGVVAATIRAMKGLAGRPAPVLVAVPDPVPVGEVHLPGPRPASGPVDPPTEEITVEFPRIEVLEPTNPALSMLSRGRHAMR